MGVLDIQVDRSNPLGRRPLRKQLSGGGELGVLRIVRREQCVHRLVARFKRLDNSEDRGELLSLRDRKPANGDLRCAIDADDIAEHRVGGEQALGRRCKRRGKRVAPKSEEVAVVEVPLTYQCHELRSAVPVLPRKPEEVSNRKGVR